MAVEIFTNVLTESDLELNDKTINAAKIFFNGCFEDSVKAARKRISERKAKLS